ncbi:hypothetical protein Tco_1326849 [Tanacetum coccineum]
MSARRNRSKRKIRVPNKYENTVCDLNKNRKARSEEVEKQTVNEEQTEIRVSDTDFGDKEVEGIDDMAQCSVERLVWSAKGISILGISLGKPLVMDDMTSQMCQYGKGMIAYARVLVEVNACKEFKEFIEVQYKDNKCMIMDPRKSKWNTHGNLQNVITVMCLDITSFHLTNGIDVEKSANCVADKDTLVQNFRRKSNKFVVLEDLEENIGDEINYV